MTPKICNFPADSHRQSDIHDNLSNLFQNMSIHYPSPVASIKYFLTTINSRRCPLLLAQIIERDVQARMLYCTMYCHVWWSCCQRTCGSGQAKLMPTTRYATVNRVVRHGFRNTRTNFSNNITWRLAYDISSRNIVLMLHYFPTFDNF